MRSLIIYCSVYRKNTEKIAVFFKERYGCELINISKMNNINVQNYDLIGFGSGVYRENLSEKLFRLVENLDLKDKDVFVFSTSGVGTKIYNKKLIKLLKSKGAILRGSFACKGSFDAKEFSNKKIFNIFRKLAESHPNEKDLKKAEEFFNEMLQSMNKR